MDATYSSTSRGYKAHSVPGTGTSFSGKETSCCVQDKRRETKQLYALAVVKTVPACLLKPVIVPHREFIHCDCHRRVATIHFAATCLPSVALPPACSPHCPLDRRPRRHAHPRPAEYHTDTSTCNSLFEELAAGKGGRSLWKRNALRLSRPNLPGGIQCKPSLSKPELAMAG